jgi:general secretion pathway protein A
MDLLAYWNLKERPFEATWDTRFFYQSRHHDEALSRLCFLVGEQSMNMGMLTGEVGCGKTLTRAVFSKKLDPKRFHVITQENSGFSFKELLCAVLQFFEGQPVKPRDSKWVMHERVRHAAERIRSEHRHLVLIFDEAQEMAAATLSELKLLTNFNGDGASVLTIVLVGQPELRERVAGLPAINQRISLRFHLTGLSAGETAEYLKHRLKAAGHPTGDLFVPEAADRAFQASHGVPRELNRIGKLALEWAWFKEEPLVGLQAVEAVIRDMESRQNLPSHE